MGITSLNDFYSDDPLDNWFYDSVTPRGLSFDGSMPKASKTPLGRSSTELASDLIRTSRNMAGILEKDITVYLKEGYHLAGVLRNVCFIAGEQSLLGDYADILVDTMKVYGAEIAHRLAKEMIFHNWTQGQLPTGTLLDVKKEIYRFPSLAVDCLALCSGITPTTVWKALKAMDRKGIFIAENAHHLKVLVSISAELRMRTYIANGGQKENLSALSALKISPGKSIYQTSDFQKVFYISDVKQLFRYYFTAIPLEKLMSGNYRKSIDYHEEALKMLQTLYTSITEHPMYACLLQKLGCAWYELADYHKAISYFERALSMFTNVYGHNTAHPDIARALSALGLACKMLGDHTKALDYFQQTLTIHRTLYGVSTAHVETASALHNVGLCLYYKGDLKKSVMILEQALQMRKKLYGQRTAHKDIAISLEVLGGAWHELGDPKKAIGYRDMALMMYRAIYGETEAHPDIASTLGSLAASWNYSDKNKAISYAQQALEMRKTVGNDTHDDTANAFNNLGSVWWKLGEHKKAISCYQEARHILRSIHGKRAAHPRIAVCLNNFGTVYGEMGLHEKAIIYCDQALRMYKTVHGPSTDHADIAQCLNNVGAGFNELGDHRKAFEYFEQALGIYKSIFGPAASHPKIAETMNNQGYAWHILGDYRKAINYYSRGLEMYKVVYGGATAHPDIAVCLGNLGTACMSLGDYRKALDCYNQSLQVLRTIYGPNSAHPFIAATLSLIGLVRDKLGITGKP
uniref:Uncharacterized protein n=1 Tax=Branchiostoma floridae TaxID=7739 RepID=C3ZRN7_BRAFL|eukprot:XP_002588826.1 hypothetical protein BRAFLDRAFT_89743 [Branchiostoma floridae]